MSAPTRPRGGVVTPLALHAAGANGNGGPVRAGTRGVGAPAGNGTGTPDGNDAARTGVHRTATRVEPSPSPIAAACLAAAMCLEQLLDATTEEIDRRAVTVRWAFDALQDLVDLTPLAPGAVPPRSTLPSPRQLARELAAWEWGTLRGFRCLESDECFAVYQATVGSGGGFVVLTFGGLYLPSWLHDTEQVQRRRSASPVTGDPLETHCAVISLNSPVLRQLAQWAPPVAAVLQAAPSWPAEQERRSAPGPRPMADGPLGIKVERD